MKYKEVYDYGVRELAEAGIGEAALDARLLLEHVCHTGRNDLLVHGDREVGEEEYKIYCGNIAKRKGRVPLQHITGEQDFMGLTFEVDGNVLIPRQDTEILVEEAMRFLHDGMDILDMCTGSGCILLSLLHYSNGCHGVGVDISQEALIVAERNWRRLQKRGGPDYPVEIERGCSGNPAEIEKGCLDYLVEMDGVETGGIKADDVKGVVKIDDGNVCSMETCDGGIQKMVCGKQGRDCRFLQSDLFEKVRGCFDIIVSNPPYIPTGVISELMEEVRLFEPREALDGKEDGLYFYRRISSQAGGFLRGGGYLFFEIGCGQAEAVKGIMEKEGFRDIAVVKDYAGLDRVVYGWK